MTDEPETGSRTRRVLLIVGGILSGLALVTCIACGAGGALCARNLPSPRPREPARYEATLYYGTWTGEGTTLVVSPSSVQWDHHGPSGNVRYNGGFGGISGQDILLNVLVTDVTLVVSQPPAVDPTTGRWTMTVEGVRLEHP